MVTQKKLPFGVGPLVQGLVNGVCGLWGLAAGLGRLSIGRRTDWDAAMLTIGQMGDDELSELIHGGQCPYPTELLTDTALGMIHCPLCGEMVLAGARHPRDVNDLIDLDPPESAWGYRDY